MVVALDNIFISILEASIKKVKIMNNEWKIKRFVVMSGAIYYANGGFEDYKGSFDTKEEADKYAETFKGDYHWTQVSDLATGEFWPDGNGCNPMRM